MLNEHAITYHDKLSMAALDYIIKKANRLGRCSREVMRVYQQEDDEGIHLYFEVQGGLHNQQMKQVKSEDCDTGNTSASSSYETSK